MQPHRYYERRPLGGGTFTSGVVGRLILVNAAVYILGILLPLQFTNFFALTPRVVVENFHFWQIFTYMFLHGGIRGDGRRQSDERKIGNVLAFSVLPDNEVLGGQVCNRTTVFVCNDGIHLHNVHVDSKYFKIGGICRRFGFLGMRRRQYT